MDAYAVKCDLCQGEGTVRYGTRPREVCHKCDGTGTLVLIDKIAKNRQMWATIKDMLFFLGVAMLAAATACAILLWRANAWKF